MIFASLFLRILKFGEEGKRLLSQDNVLIVRNILLLAQCGLNFLYFNIQSGNLTAYLQSLVKQTVRELTKHLTSDSAGRDGTVVVIYTLNVVFVLYDRNRPGSISLLEGALNITVYILHIVLSKAFVILTIIELVNSLRFLCEYRCS